MIFNIRLNPKSSKTSIDGVWISPEGEKYIKISVNTPPIDGKANKSLIEFLSKHLKIAKTNIKIVKGEHDRNKSVEIYGYDEVVKEFLKENDSNNN
ncbi:MAG: hypothetical protein BWY78_01017 [Alphaproteobacteria bacterium ADurb.Bin438]|nr:MAG: hypothetical protein BWY78_01017 [Alphaproteobacteria bacterium ADurb.Bin438]